MLAQREEEAAAGVVVPVFEQVDLTNDEDLFDHSLQEILDSGTTSTTSLITTYILNNSHNICYSCC